MKVLVLNGSPRGKRGATGLTLSPFIKGMEHAGATVDLVDLHRLKIKPCRGCFTCWWKTPGVCVYKDDMKEMLEKQAAADLIVYATPVYVDGVTGTMKVFMDRSLPLLEGRWEIHDGHCRHPLREGVKPNKMALFAVSGFTEMDNFDPVITHMKAAALNMRRVFVGAILRPSAWVMIGAEKRGISIDKVMGGLTKAGEELVKQGKLSETTLEVVTEELVPREQIVKEF